ncbi:MAG: protein-L-isoaspartate O-methyltransferase family protein [Pseudonocardiaceae bacterium]
MDIGKAGCGPVRGAGRPCLHGGDPPKARSARLARVQTKNADGYLGWAEHGPYDGIIITAAPDHIPAPLVEQLREGGHMVVPIGPPGSYQTLWRLTKQQGKVVSEDITDVAFVPLVRKP